MKVLIADDNPLVRIGLRAVLEPIASIGEVLDAPDGATAIAMVKEYEPDVVLLDVRMPGLNGLEVLREIADLTTVLMMTSTDDAAIVRRALEDGAKGYMVHGALSGEDLAAALQSARAGGTVIAGVAASTYVASAQAWEVAADISGTGFHARLEAGMTPQEREVMKGIVAGRRNDEIAADLCLSPKTVKNYVSKLYTKLGVGSRHEAVALWLSKGSPEGVAAILGGEYRVAERSPKKSPSER